MSRLLRPRLLAAIGISLALVGCLQELPFIPSGATQVITVDKGQPITVEFKGEYHLPSQTAEEIFLSIHEELKRAGKSDDADPMRKEFEAKRLEREWLKQFRESVPDATVRKLANGNYQIALVIRENPRVQGNPILSMAQVDELDQWVRIQPNREVDNKLAELKEPELAQVRTMVRQLMEKRYRGKLLVRVRGGIVDEHNAQEVTDLADGFKQYAWDIRSGQNNPAIVIDNNSYSERQLILRQAKPGTPCMELIGQACKCGPFELREESGQPLSRVKTVISVDGAQHNRCSDAQGRVEAVILENYSKTCRIAVSREKCAP